MAKNKELGISGSFASSRGQAIGSINEDLANYAIEAAALVYCPHCEQPLLTDWQFCPKCGGEIMFAPLVGINE